MLLSRRSFITGSAATLLAGRGLASTGMRRLGGPAFGSYWTALVPDTAVDHEVLQAVASLVDAGDRLFSPYRGDSELSRFNRLPAGETIGLSNETRYVIEAARDCHRRSSGAFDPTVGPTVARFGFGPIDGDAGAAFGLLELSSRRVVKPVDGYTIDLCGIAKGRVLDQIVARLDAMGLESFLVELGGEVFARGQSASGRPWRVLIDSAGAISPYVLELRDQAVATSALHPQSYELSTAHYSHIVDPRLQAPVPDGPVAVSVVSSTAMEADALATAMIAMTTDRADQFARAQQLDAVLFSASGALVLGRPSLKALE